MSVEKEPDLRELLRRAICEFIEPMVISHLTKDTEWREEANMFICECAPLVFGPNETVFGQGLSPEELANRVINLSRDGG